MRKTRILLTALSLFLLSCSGDEEPPVNPAVGNDLQLMANASILQTAVQVFATTNDGQTPADVDTDTNRNGDTLIDLLPDGHRFLNPYTGEFTEPRNVPATHPGEIGYVPTPWGGVQVVYAINAWGSTSEIVSLGNLESLEQRTIDHAYLVRDAAEAFAAANAGVYPANVGVDETPSGKTLIDFLPLGQLLNNPFNLAATTPIDGAAATPGAVGYVQVVQANVTVGYSINAQGWQEEILAIEKP